MTDLPSVRPPEPGDPQGGPLGRVTGVVYWYLVVTVLMNVTTLPGVMVLMLLDRSAGNAPLAALCFVPIGPALSAALFALRERPQAEALTPAASFWRGYRLNAFDVLRLWAPAMMVLAVIALSLGNLDAAGVPPGYAWVLAVIAALVLLWTMNGLVIASTFHFRPSDVARLAAYHLARLPLVTLRTASLIFLAGVIVVITFDAVLAMLGGVWAGLLLHSAAPLIGSVEARFTRHG